MQQTCNFYFSSMGATLSQSATGSCPDGMGWTSHGQGPVSGPSCGTHHMLVFSHAVIVDVCDDVSQMSTIMLDNKGFVCVCAHI